MSSERDLVEHAGESELVTFEVEDKPDPNIRIEQIGDDPDIRWRYQWDERGQPTPEQFERVGHIETLLVTMLPNFDGDVLDAGDAAHSALVALKEAMMDARDLDDEQRKEVALGNLDGLPEVEKRRPDR